MKQNCFVTYNLESLAEPLILFEFKEGINFNHPKGICSALHGAGRNIFYISKLKFEPDPKKRSKGRRSYQEDIFCAEAKYIN